MTVKCTPTGLIPWQLLITLRNPYSVNVLESCEQSSCGVQARGLPEHVQHEGLTRVVIKLALERKNRRQSVSQ